MTSIMGMFYYTFDSDHGDVRLNKKKEVGTPTSFFFLSENQELTVNTKIQFYINT